jgi:hypothetical protein
MSSTAGTGKCDFSFSQARKNLSEIRTKKGPAGEIPGRGSNEIFAYKGPQGLFLTNLIKK